MTGLLDNLSVEDATAEEVKVTRTRASAQPDAGVTALLTTTLGTDTPKKITLPSEADVKTLTRAVKVAAAAAGIGYRLKVDGLVVYVKGAPKKNYVISAESARARAEKSAATRAAKTAHPAGKGK